MVKTIFKEIFNILGSNEEKEVKETAIIIF
jgi:hypothetical protein